MSGARFGGCFCTAHCRAQALPGGGEGQEAEQACLESPKQLSVTPLSPLKLPMLHIYINAMALLPLLQGVGLSHPWDFQAFLGSLDQLLLAQISAQAASSATKRLDKGSRGAPFFR